MIEIKQSTASYALVFQMLDSTTNLPKTGLTVTATLSKNGGTFASASGAVTEIGNGLYKVAANSTDSNTLGTLAVSGAATGAYCLGMCYAVVANLESDTYTRIGAPVGASISADIAAVAAGVWAAGTRTLTAISDSAGITTLLTRIASALTITSGKVAVATNDDKTGYALSTAPPTAAATATAVRSELATELARIDVATSTRNSTTPLTAATTRSAIGLASANLDTQLSSLATGANLATAKTAIDAIKAKTDNLPIDPAAVSDVPSVVTISSAVWSDALRTLTASADSPGIATLLADTSTLLLRIPSALSISSGQVTVGTNADKTGYSLVAAPLTASGTRAALGMASANLDAQIATLSTASALAVVDGVADATLAIAQKLDTALELDGSVYRFTENALEQGPAGGGGGGGSGLSEETIAALEAAEQILLVELYEPTEEPTVIINAPTNPELSRAYLFTERIIGLKREGLEMIIKVANAPAKSGRALERAPESAMTDADGYVSLDIVRGVEYEVRVPSIGLKETFTPDDSTFDLATLIP